MSYGLWNDWNSSSSSNNNTTTLVSLLKLSRLCSGLLPIASITFPAPRTSTLPNTQWLIENSQWIHCTTVWSASSKSVYYLSEMPNLLCIAFFVVQPSCPSLVVLDRWIETDELAYQQTDRLLDRSISLFVQSGVGKRERSLLFRSFFLLLLLSGVQVVTDVQIDGQRERKTWLRMSKRLGRWQVFRFVGRPSNEIRNRSSELELILMFSSKRSILFIAIHPRVGESEKQRVGEYT